MKKKISFYMILLGIILSGYSQNYSYVNTDKGISHDKNNSRATNIKIPLYTAKVDGVQIPIYLSYNNKGIKVCDVPSSVGFNWELQAGGTISKKVNHLPDESQNGWFFNYDLSNYQPGVFYGNTSQIKDLFKHQDAAPDIFYMNMTNGDYANFLYEHESNEIGDFLYPVFLNQSKNISYVHTNLDLLSQYRYHKNEEFLYENDEDADITVSNNSGVNYLFRKDSKRQRPWDIRRRAVSFIDSADYKKYNIHKITTDTNNEFIEFEYTEVPLFKFIRHVKATRTQTNDVPQTPPSQNDPIITSGFYQDISVEDVSRKEIKKITTSNETIEFTYKEVNYTNSLEVAISEQPPFEIYDKLQNQVIKLLDEIKIYDYKGDYVLGYKFTYTEQTQNQNLYEGSFKLKAIHKYGKNHKDTIVFKKFDYYYDGSPTSVISTAQDVFGYPNNTTVNNDTNFTPVQIYQAVADRMPNENALIEGMLKSITNTAGGKTEYIYKENKYQEMYYGGLLVDQVLSYDKNGVLARKTQYAYDNPEGFGLPIYNIPTYPQGGQPPNIYEDGYFEGYQDAWQTYFTKKDPLMDLYNYQYLTSYIVSESPYELLKKTPQMNQLLSDLGLQIFDQISSGSFYTKITETKINVDTDTAENGYVVYNYRPSISNFILSKKLQNITYYNSADQKVEETYYHFETLNHGQIDAFKFDNTHMQSDQVNPSLFRYVVESYPIYKIEDVVRYIEKKEFDDNGNEIVYKTTFSYLNEDDNDITTTDYNRVKESVKYFNGVPYRKNNFKYLSEYQNVPDEYQGLEIKNPAIEENVWTKSTNSWKLASSQITNYLSDGKIEKLSEYIGNKTTKTYFDETDFTWSYFDSNGNLISNSEDILEYTYDDNGKLIIEKNTKSQISTIYQRSSEYNGLYVDATLVTNDKYDPRLPFFIKKSFENNFDDPQVIKVNNAFSGDFVFTGNSISLGTFSGNSEVSFWAYENNKWKFYTYVHPGGIIIINKPSEALYIDEIRVQPTNSLMMTNTFMPLIGATSTLDDTGKGYRTEYDILGRKLYDLDQERNVLKEYRYNTKEILINN